MPRQSPEESATVFAVGTVKKGFDGNKWKVVEVQMKSTGKTFQRWQRVATNTNGKPAKTPARSQGKTPAKTPGKKPTETKEQGTPKTKSGAEYFTHDNGARAFKVLLTKTTASVYGPSDEAAESWDEVQESDYNVLVRKFTNVKKIFIGTDSEMMKSWPEAIGNSILLYMGVVDGEHQYVHIGERVFSFVTPKDDKIVTYCSPIGGSDVPYPVAVGKRHYYFMLTRAFLPIGAFKSGLSCEQVDIYSLPKEIWEPSKKRSLPGYKLIQKRLHWDY